MNWVYICECEGLHDSCFQNNILNLVYICECEDLHDSCFQRDILNLVYIRNLVGQSCPKFPVLLSTVLT